VEELKVISSGCDRGGSERGGTKNYESGGFPNGQGTCKTQLLPFNEVKKNGPVLELERRPGKEKQLLAFKMGNGIGSAKN